MLYYVFCSQVEYGIVCFIIAQAHGQAVDIWSEYNAGNDEPSREHARTNPAIRSP